ncbi:hypothetical protein JOD31_003147 [Methylopila capsulata]|uniref:Uncharacterized protein n=1 Tax=Methylopila capsulata TaxID=61654 RepID=A0A9W6MTH3_9HYPH|nr:hypothetical protein [Methylopila capsulata]MBM7852905.1 hypothetical protein [Methylopila capsulata]GLK57116.1 hypothetical protein GCM10008170_31350 [Methylopila capsulata]
MPVEIFFIPLLLLVIYFIVALSARFGDMKDGITTKWSEEHLGPTLRLFGPLFGAMLVLFALMALFGE